METEGGCLLLKSNAMFSLLFMTTVSEGTRTEILYIELLFQLFFLMRSTDTVPGCTLVFG